MAVCGRASLARDPRSALVCTPVCTSGGWGMHGGGLTALKKRGNGSRNASKCRKSTRRGAVCRPQTRSSTRACKWGTATRYPLRAPCCTSVPGIA
eukprot:578920-Rhodomonas_salina.1